MAVPVNASGVYVLIIRRPGRRRKFYIGQAVRLKTRFKNHIFHLKRGSSNNPKLQSAFNKYGRRAFIFKTVLLCESNMLDLYEQAILDFYVKTYGSKRLCNINQFCIKSRRGVKTSKLTRKRQSIAQRRVGRTPAQLRSIELMRLANLGRKLSSASIEKRNITRQANAKARGYYFSAETNAKRAAAHRGRKHTPETIAKIKIAKKGWIPPPHHIEHLRTVNIGRKMPDSTRLAVYLSHKGIPKPSEEIARRNATRRANAALEGRTW